MKKKLRRDEEQAIVSGVLAGLANYWNQDPVLFRVMAVVFLIVTGFFPGILLYIGAWLVMPKQNSNSRKVDYEVSE